MAADQALPAARLRLRAKAPLAIAAPFIVLFFVPGAGVIALVLALAALPGIRAVGMQPAGGWGVVWLGGMVLGGLGTLWTVFVVAAFTIGDWLIF